LNREAFMALSAADADQGRKAMTDRTRSHAYGALRDSSRRLLKFVESEIARNDGKPVTLFADQFVIVGSVRIIVPCLLELTVLGFIERQRFPKRHRISLSDR